MTSVMPGANPSAVDSSDRQERRAAIRPPKFAGSFALLDFDALPAPVISMFEPPAPSAPGDYTLALRGEDLKVRPVSWQELEGLPRHDIAADLVCQIFNWHEPVVWTGYRVSDVLDAFGLAEARNGYLKFLSGDGQYFETLSLDDARDARTMLATGMDGAPLGHAYGGPVRLVVPFLQGYKSVKWLQRIELYRNDPVGIKRLLGQSKTSRLGQAWLDRLGIVPSEGRPSDPV